MAFACVAALGALSGAVALFVFERFTNHDRLRRAANRIIGHLLEVQLFLDEPRFVLRAQRGLLAANARLLLQLLLPSLILALPFALLFTIMNQCFGFAPLEPGEAALVTVHYENSPPASPPRLPPGLEIDAPPVHIPSAHQIVWRTHATNWLRPGWFIFPFAANNTEIAYRPATIFHAPWLVWFSAASLVGAALSKLPMRRVFNFRSTSST
jgi:hypothetical protein